MEWAWRERCLSAVHVSVCALHACSISRDLIGPRAPELIIRSFDGPKTQATHVRLVVLSTQCTGFAGYAGEQDNDPRANSDCATAEPAAASQTTHVDEFQVFSR
jgi:hypothetical protein